MASRFPERPDATPQSGLTPKLHGMMAELLYRLMPVDGLTHRKEEQRFRRIMSDNFGLSGDEIDHILSPHCESRSDAHSLENLARELKCCASREELLGLISHLWEMAFADGLLHETEIIFVERVAELLDISQGEVERAMHI